MSRDLLVLGATGSDVVSVHMAGFEVAVASLRGPGKDENEDGALVVDLGEGGIALAVADGMGGMSHGALAAKLTLGALESTLASRAPGSSRRAAIVEGIERAHVEVLTHCDGGGATLVAAVLTGAEAQIVHSGDAEALVIGGGGKLRHRTVPHSPVGYAQAAGLLTEAEALIHPERHVVSSGVGVEGIEIQVGPKVATRVRDTVLLASDGLFDNVVEGEVLEIAPRGTPEDAAERLIELARGRMLASLDSMDPLDLGKPDDLTLVVARRARSGRRAARRPPGATP